MLSFFETDFNSQVVYQSCILGGCEWRTNTDDSCYI